MGASSLQKLSDLHFYVSGPVTIHPDATIASDVFLQADPNSHLIIGPRASIGPNSILHAFQGTLEIGSDVTIGTKVLVVGTGVIRSGACVGAFSTLMFQIDVQEQSVIPPRSLMGDESRKVNLDTLDDEMSSSEVAGADDNQNGIKEGDRPRPEAPPADVSGTQPAPPSIQKSVVYGRASVEKLIKVMFPARAYDLNGNHSDDEEGDRQ